MFFLWEKAPWNVPHKLKTRNKCWSEREKSLESAKLEMARNRIFSSKEKINSFDSDQENIFSQCLKIVFV